MTVLNSEAEDRETDESVIQYSDARGQKDK
jgi:hypothetical protein